MLLQGKNAVITGGSDGIGKAIAQLFASNGAHLWLIGRNEQKLLAAARDLSVYQTNVFHTAADISNYEALLQACSAIAKVWRGVDIIVNNAGIAIFRPFTTLTRENYDAHFNLNVRAPVFLVQQLLPLLTKKDGAVINISSYFSDRMLPHIPSSLYSATKGAINSLTKALAVELGPSIRVNAIAPGTIDTTLVQGNLAAMTTEKRQAFRSYVQSNYPMKTIGQPEHIAEMALFLASAKANWITGGVFPVDGGLTTT